MQADGQHFVFVPCPSTAGYDEVSARATMRYDIFMESAAVPKGPPEARQRLRAKADISALIAASPALAAGQTEALAIAHACGVEDELLRSRFCISRADLVHRVLERGRSQKDEGLTPELMFIASEGTGRRAWMALLARVDLADLQHDAAEEDAFYALVLATALQATVLADRCLEEVADRCPEAVFRLPASSRTSSPGAAVDTAELCVETVLSLLSQDQQLRLPRLLAASVAGKQALLDCSLSLGIDSSLLSEDAIRTASNSPRDEASKMPPVADQSFVGKIDDTTAAMNVEGQHAATAASRGGVSTGAVTEQIDEQPASLAGLARSLQQLKSHDQYEELRSSLSVSTISDAQPTASPKLASIARARLLSQESVEGPDMEAEMSAFLRSSDSSCISWLASSPKLDGDIGDRKAAWCGDGSECNGEVHAAVMQQQRMSPRDAFPHVEAEEGRHAHPVQEVSPRGHQVIACQETGNEQSDVMKWIERWLASHPAQSQTDSRNCSRKEERRRQLLQRRGGGPVAAPWAPDVAAVLQDKAKVDNAHGFEATTGDPRRSAQKHAAAHYDVPLTQLAAAELSLKYAFGENVSCGLEDFPPALAKEIQSLGYAPESVSAQPRGDALKDARSRSQDKQPVFHENIGSLKLFVQLLEEDMRKLNESMDLAEFPEDRSEKKPRTSAACRQRQDARRSPSPPTVACESAVSRARQRAAKHRRRLVEEERLAETARTQARFGQRDARLLRFVAASRVARSSSRGRTASSASEDDMYLSERSPPRPTPMPLSQRSRA
eukprot:TRINITY_DN43926_c0_g1_i3.p1 TRINITY_DN43926_c0_g1~~TRINITY_DN43926_c0_g1_i3.p1  ORF type:complete len:783 (+),score=139.07 TRINITY_DN43926_c0_g1_i3:75-2423(+)